MLIYREKAYMQGLYEKYQFEKRNLTSLTPTCMMYNYIVLKLKFPLIIKPVAYIKMVVGFGLNKGNSQ